MTLEEMIGTAINFALHRGEDTEFVLRHLGAEWSAELCNEIGFVKLGENEPKYVGRGGNPTEAMQSLLDVLRSAP